MVKTSIELQVTLLIFFAGVFFGGIFLDVDLGSIFLNAAFHSVKSYLLSLSFICATPLVILLILQIFGKNTPEEDRAWYTLLKRLFHLSSIIIFAIALGLISTFLFLKLIKMTIVALSFIISIVFFILIVILTWLIFKKKFQMSIFDFLKH